jgi:hypothetical protein
MAESFHVERPDALNLALDLLVAGDLDRIRPAANRAGA